MASGDFTPTTGGSPSTVIIEQKLRAEQIVKNGAGWFLAIAGLSILNSMLNMSGAQFHFIFGLGITEIVDSIGRQSGATGSALGFVVNLFIAGFFLWFWYFGRKGEKWAFVTGMSLYVMDGLLLVPFRDLLGLAFHAYALYRIYNGMRGIPVLQEIQRRLAPADAPIVPS